MPNQFSACVSIPGHPCGVAGRVSPRTCFLFRPFIAQQTMERGEFRRKNEMISPQHGIIGIIYRKAAIRTRKLGLGNLLRAEEVWRLGPHRLYPVRRNGDAPNERWPLEPIRSVAAARYKVVRTPIPGWELSVRALHVPTVFRPKDKNQLCKSSRLDFW